MKITEMVMHNIRCYGMTDVLKFNDINIIIGENNTGKSTLLKSIYKIQDLSSLTKDDISLDKTPKKSSLISFNIKDCSIGIIDPYWSKRTPDQIQIDLINNRQQIIEKDSGAKRDIPYNKINTEPNNLIYPFFSQRHGSSFSISVGEKAVKGISPDYSFLFAKIDQLRDPDYIPANPKNIDKFRALCKNLLGFTISTESKGEGKLATRIIDSGKSISIERMGDGIPHVLKLLVDIIQAKNKIFLIEEIENNLHPKLLKQLLEIIKESSIENQFFITTHSNIVLKTLGSEYNSKIFYVKKTTPTTSDIEQINNDEHKRRFEILKELGYDFSDFGLWEGWLILEESTADKIIRDYFIPWYTPRLSRKLKPIASNGINDVKKRIKALMDLFVFIHLESIYKNNAWILIDDGEDEKKIIEELKKDFSSWDSNHFINLSKHNFEEYYPEIFNKDVSALNSLHHNEKYKPKVKLLNKVIKWIEEDTSRAQKEFAVSAKEVIKILKMIENKLCK